MQNDRVRWIDIAKGIGIIFVIYAHVLGSHDYRHLIYAFHMPFFFFLSGAVYKSDKYINVLNFLKKNIKSILIPYLIFAFVSFILWLTRFNSFNNIHPQIIKQFLSIFYGNSNLGLLAFNNILWFLPALFVTKFLFGFFYNLLKTKFNAVIFLIIISILGYSISIFLPRLKLPLSTESALTGIVFYGLGYLWFNSKNAKETIIKFRYVLFPSLVILGSLIANIDFNNYGHQIDIRLNLLNNYFYFYLSAISGIFAWISLSIIINKNSFLEYLGRNSLILFVWHPFIFYYLRLHQSAILGEKFIQNIRIYIPAIHTGISIFLILGFNIIYKKIKLLFINLFPKPQTK